MKKNTKLAILGAGTIAGVIAALYLIRRKKQSKENVIASIKKTFDSDEKILSTVKRYEKRDVIGFDIEDSILYYQSEDNNVIAFYLLEDREEVCRIYIPSENRYSTFSDEFKSEEVSYLLELNNFEDKEDYSFEIGIYCSKTGKFIDTLIFDSDANVFIKE